MYSRFSARIAVAAMVLTLALFAGGATVLAHSGGTPPGEAQGGCPVPFHLHEANHHNHEGDHPHHHVGTDTDKNGDGWICVQHVGAGGKVHVHIDNNLPQ